MQKYINCLLVVMMFLIFTNITAKQNEMQQIRGGFAFPVDGNKVKVRISVDPKSLIVKKESVETILKKITTVMCVEGECKFASHGTGLGFFEATFHKPKHDSFRVLTIACSHLGCDKADLKVKIIRPHQK